ncbi:recombinase family protein [Cryobacterium arcticum]|nr:recombinase family protein [Cryobacterium arcticum]
MVSAIYTRQSLDKTGDAVAVDRQLAETRALAEVNGLSVTDDFVFTDNDMSATSGKPRPAFNRLLKLVEDGTVETIVVWHADRLYRKLSDLVEITKVAQVSGLKILTVQAGELDLSTPTGRLVAGLLGSVATYEGEHRTERQKSAFKAAATNGIWHFSHRPFGYRRDPGTKIPVVVPSEAEELRSLFERYSTGESRHALVLDLNKRGIRPGGGRPWHVTVEDIQNDAELDEDQRAKALLAMTTKTWTITQLRSVLANERYTAVSRYKGEIVGTGNWDAILTPEQWEKYTGAASLRKTVKSSFSRTATSLLSGILRCSVCNGKMYQRQRNDPAKTKEYSCWENHCVSIKASVVDVLAARAVVSSLFLAPTSLVSGTGHDTTSLTEALSHIDTQRKEQHGLTRDNLATASDIRPTLVRLQAEEVELLARLEKIKLESVGAEVLMGMKSDLLSPGLVPWDDGAAVKSQLKQRFEKLSLPRQRTLTRLLIDVTVGKGRDLSRVIIWHKVVTTLNGPQDEHDA